MPRRNDRPDGTIRVPHRGATRQLWGASMHNDRPQPGHALIHVGIVDDHPVVSLGAAAVLNTQPDIYVTATATTVEALQAYGQWLDVVLLDLGLADLTDFRRNIRLLSNDGAQVLAFATDARPKTIRDAMRAGAVGVVQKAATTEVIVRAVRQAAHRDHPGSARPDGDASPRDAGLSSREREVLALYAAGDTAARVAERLFISRETVYDHIRRIRGKYAVVGRPAPSKVDLFHRAVEDRVIAGR